MTIRPLPKKFEEQLAKASREQLVQQIRELYEALCNEWNPERPQHVCESCGALTADRPEIFAHKPEVMVYPPTCRLCRMLGLGENMPFSQCSDRLKVWVLKATVNSPEPTHDLPKCDNCKGPAVYQCHCERCSREPDADSKFHCCSKESCGPRVIDKHSRVYGRAIVWGNL